jgi:hypothetical protein
LSPSPLPAWLKMIFAVASFTSLLVFLFRSGTARSETNQEDSGSDFQPGFDLKSKFRRTISHGDS